MTEDIKNRPDAWLTYVARANQAVRLGVIVFGLAFALLAGYLGYANASKYAPFIAYGVAMGMLGLGTILYLLLREPVGGESEANVGRRVVLVVGGLAGLFTFVLGLALLYVWWESVFTGGLEKWRENVLAVLGTLAAQFGGLAIMFASLQVARAEVRTDPTLRILMYGYNAVLTGILLFYVLGLLNLLSYMPVQRAPVLGQIKTFLDTPIDWTQHGQYTLAPETVSSLRTLNKPVKIYAILPNSSPYRADAEILLNSFRGLTDQLTVEYLSPDLDADRVKDLAKEYKVSAREGFLIVVGTKPKEEFEFIDLDSAISTTGGMSGSQRARSVFQGEYVLVRQINFIAREGKVKPIIYFTQGHGEPPLNDAQAKSPINLSALKGELDKADMEVKELALGVNATKVPDDAAVLVVIRPTAAFEEPVVKALREFMSRPVSEKQKKGKLVALLDIVTTPDNKMVETGLEGLLAEYGVQVGNDRILTLRPPARNPATIVAAIDPDNRTTLGRVLATAGWGVFLTDVRTVTPMPNAPGGKYRAEPFMVNATPLSWAETNLAASPRDLAADLLKEERAKERESKLKRELPVAVTVVEPAPPAPAGGAKEEDESRLVVFGDADWVNADNMRRSGGVFGNIFVNSVEWLRGRPDLGKLPDPKEPEMFVLPKTVNEYQIRLVSGVLMIFGIIALGGGVWVVRRR